jgi:hypothetical protein
MTPDWSQVTQRHVQQACELYDAGTVPTRAAKSTFLLLNGKTYPAKFIRGLAYRLATGIELDPSRDYAGGLETIKFFERLGFATKHNPSASPDDSTLVSPPLSEEPVSAQRQHREPQKRALHELLRQRSRVVKRETTFPWLTVPSPDQMDKPISSIYQALQIMRGYSSFASFGKSLCCDFFLPDERLIIEYDERQHFTLQRAKALELYPLDLPLGFDREEWITSCQTIHATDPRSAAMTLKINVYSDYV